ncbi:homoaconitase/3-isopropylmalate dehydratase large subunit [Cupriavidus metallidurans]
MAKTRYDKLRDDHTVHGEEDGATLLYLDRHLLHDVSSPQAFEGLKPAQRSIRLCYRMPDSTVTVTCREQKSDQVVASMPLGPWDADLK